MVTWRDQPQRVALVTGRPVRVQRYVVDSITMLLMPSLRRDARAGLPVIQWGNTLTDPLNLRILTLRSFGTWGLLCTFSTFLMAGLAMLSSGLGFSHPNPGLLLGMFLAVACATGMTMSMVRYEVAWYLNWHWRRVRGVVHPDPYAPPWKPARWLIPTDWDLITQVLVAGFVVWQML